MKVILNKCYGGFDVSDECYGLYAKKKGVKLFRYVDDYGMNLKKISDGNAGMNSIAYYFVRDYGEFLHRDDIDWDDYIYLGREHREDPILIECVEELGTERASGRFGELVVVDIPDGMDYVIDEYDGIETLHQRVEEW
jgi:hypothetical protein